MRSVSLTRPARHAALGVMRGITLGAVVLSISACTDRLVTALDDTSTSTAHGMLATTVIAQAAAASAANDVALLQMTSFQLGGAGRVQAPGAGLASLRSAHHAGQPAPSADVTYGGLDCAYDAGTQRFACPEVALGSMTIGAEYALYDGNGAPQSTYDDATTARAQIWFTTLGSLVSPAGGADIRRVRTLAVSNLAGAETTRTFGGNGTDVAIGIFAGMPARSYVLADTTTISSVVYGVPFAANVWPRSGTLATNSQLAITEQGATTITHRHVEIRFNGTPLVEMDVDAARFTLNLADGSYTTRP
ncbi:MAG: hypothetical protein WKG32_23300 [Gemmatimonadaceae bacterium]